MAMQWTKDQQNAIAARGTSLMVSAAAGSGKTSVLTQRIVSLLSEKNGPSSSRLAVVTFTKAAAKNLEDKLYRALSDLVAKNPEDTALSRQLMGLAHAQISTIHSFCYALIRGNKKALGLGENLRIADEGRILPLQKKAVEEAVEEFLEDSVKDPLCLKLCRIFTTSRSLAGLYDALFLLFEKISCLPGGIDSLKEICDRLEKEILLLREGSISLSETNLGKGVSEEALSLLIYAKETFAALKGALENTQVLSEKYLPFLEEREALAAKGIDLCKKGNFFEAAKLLEEGFSTSMPRITKCPPEEKEIKDGVSEIHNRLKKSLLAFCRSHMKESLPALLKESEESITLTRKFLLLAENALEKFSAEKEKRGFLDYGDLENLTLKLVAEKKNGIWQKSALGEKITEEFDAVFVDEYQDSNAIQDLIFRCITKKDNLFIVGDPKQSIYRFRGAEPEIFSSYKNTLPRYPSDSDEMQAIFLSHNFRSSENILSFVNRIFRVVMENTAPDSLYKEEDELRAGKESEKPSPRVEIVLMEKKKEEEKEVFSEAAQLLHEENTEAKYIASRIRGMLTSYKPRDIAVICRTHRQIAMVRDSLELLGIPCSTAKSSAIQEEREYLFVHSLLLALDNPDRDVPLLGALLSPVFRFSSDELLAVRNLKKEGSFYSALTLGKEDPSFALCEKCREVYDCLKALREKSKHLTLTALIFHLYSEFSISYLFGKENFHIKDFFLKCAENAESVGEYSLSDFAAYLDRAAETGGEEEEEGDGVHLLTIHKSKGLEFPVVFASFLAQKFDRRDESSKLILSPEKGVVFHIPSENGRIRRNSFMRKGAALSLHRAMLEEEKRVLYVALTRAVEKLILTANPRSYASLKRDLILVSEKVLSSPLLKELLAHADSPLHFVLLALRDSPAVRRILEEGGSLSEGEMIISIDSPAECSPWRGERSTEKKEKFDSERVLSDLLFRYESGGLDTLPEKLSVSEILKAGREEEAELSPRRLLDFDRARLTSSAAQIGTATHKVMQFADFENMEKDGEKEFSRLKEKGFLSEEEFALAEKEKILAFFGSELYGKIKQSPLLVREKRFNVLFDGKELLEKDGEVLVQGVIDAFFENPDGTLTLLDFKTDRVKKEGGEEILISRHGDQLRLYSKAVEKLTEKKVSSLLIWSFSLGKALSVPPWKKNNRTKILLP